MNKEFSVGKKNHNYIKKIFCFLWLVNHGGFFSSEFYVHPKDVGDKLLFLELLVLFCLVSQNQDLSHFWIDRSK